MFIIKNVSKKFKNEYALRNISITIGNGLNFIIGSSGSGKTTLLKILSGMEQSFEGEVFYCEQSIKELTEKEKSYFYHNILGFVWQDFNLLDDRTVLENIILPQYLGNGQNEKEAIKIMRELKISGLANQKVAKLSGGQKQRVAIARELMKKPHVLLADEPTSALDEKSTKGIMDILRDISKSRIVIVVTHDTTLIGKNDKVYELDKGELISTSSELVSKSKFIDKKRSHHLSLKSSWKLALNNTKIKWGRLAATTLSLLVSATLLLVIISGTISSSSTSAFDKLFDTYGKSILDISIASNFISAGGTDNQENDKPNADVSQDIGGLYEKYLTDNRVDYLVFTQAFNDIEITIEGKEYIIESSGSVPAINEPTAGTMPMGADNEVVVPNSFIKSLGITDEEALGKKINFSGSIYNWDSGEPVAMSVSTTAKIVGVVDTTVKYEGDEKIMEYSVDDSFFFSKSALDEMKTQANTMKTDVNFTIRAKNPADLITIKDELNANGIVPLGRFELVEDMVRLSDQTSNQSDSASLVIGGLSIVVVLAVSLMTALYRRQEYAIYKISGYSNGHLAFLNASETFIFITCSMVLFLIVSPLLNLATSAFWGINILSGKLLATGLLLVICTGMFSGIVTGIICATTKTEKALMTGEK